MQSLKWRILKINSPETFFSVVRSCKRLLHRSNSTFHRGRPRRMVGNRFRHYHPAALMVVLVRSQPHSDLMDRLDFDFDF